jgi:IS6 family transposase
MICDSPRRVAFAPSSGDVEELLGERGVQVDHVTDLTVGAAVRTAADRRSPALSTRPGRSLVRGRDVCKGRRAVGVSVSGDRPVRPGHRRPDLGEEGSDGHPPVFIRALEHGRCPTEVSTDRAPAYPRVINELIPAACHVVELYANNPVEADHGRLKARLRPMRGLKQLHSAGVISAGHAFVQNLRRGHYELGWDIDRPYRLTAIFTELAHAI